jgi:response regulator RpfG family c-di-GMP phosphodiesterase
MTKYTENKKILYVDDEKELLNSFTSLMRKENLQIHTLNESMKIEDMINSEGPFAVVLSDQRMPDYDGVKVLEIIKQNSPETIRVLVTGYSDYNDTIRAINAGGITSYISKPWKDEEFKFQVSNWVTQYNLKQQNSYLLNRLDEENKKLNELLEGTLKGSIKVLVDILSLFNSHSFSRSNHLRKIARNIAFKLQLKKAWEIEIAILLSQIGCIGIPLEILEKKSHSLPLTYNEEKLYNTYPAIGKSLIKNIPRLEIVAEIISFQLSEEPAYDYIANVESNLPVAVNLLKLLIDFDSLVSSGRTEKDAVKIIRHRAKYDRELITALDVEVAGIYDGLTIVKKELADLKEGTVLAADIKDINGNVILKKGNELSQVALLHLLNYSTTKAILTPVLILE